MYDLATNHAAEHYKTLASHYQGTVAAAFCGVNPFTGETAHEEDGEIDDTITPDTPGVFDINMT